MQQTVATLLAFGRQQGMGSSCRLLLLLLVAWAAVLLVPLPV
jgi:hypothetical protein